MKEAYVWLSNKLIGRFWEDENGSINFEYEVGAKTLMSLSLPLNGSWDKDAPGLYIDGLLPDSEAERVAMKRVLRAETSSPLDLLIAVDSTGGLVFTKEPVLDSVDHLQRQVAREEEIGNQVYLLANNRGSWQAKDGRSRFSLAGTQCKFSLEAYGDKWLWPNAKYPSTHIVKPASSIFPEVDKIENATMRLAQLCGLRAANSEVLTFGDERAYVTERFDRKVLPDGNIERLHIEDFAQALGVPSSEKYRVSVKDIVKLLKKLPNGDELVAQWFGQLAFNTIVGNCDAHSKNYSLFLPPIGDVSLCPLYDSVCTRFWPDVNDELAMPINGEHRAEELSLDDWAAEAVLDGVDQLSVIETVANMAMAVARNLDDALDGLPDEIRGRMHQIVVKNNETLFGQLGLVDENGKLLRQPSLASVEHAVFSSNMQLGTLSGNEFDAISSQGGMVRIEFHREVQTSLGQSLDDAYILVDGECVDEEGNLTLRADSQVELYDSRIDLAIDSLWWAQICDACRNELGRPGCLIIDRKDDGRCVAGASSLDKKLAGKSDESRQLCQGNQPLDAERIKDMCRGAVAKARSELVKRNGR